MATLVCVVPILQTLIECLEKLQGQIYASAASNDMEGILMATVKEANEEIKSFQESKKSAQKFLPERPKKKAKTTLASA